MKKFAMIVAVLATLAGNAAHAQTTMNKNGSNTTGAGARAGTFSTDNFAWGIGLGGLAVLGIVVGITVGGALGDQPSFSH